MNRIRHASFGAETRAELEVQLHQIRAEGLARDEGEIHPGLRCIAIPWPSASLPAAIACIGSRADMAAQAAIIERCLRAAVRAGATALDIIRTAAEAAR